MCVRVYWIEKEKKEEKERKEVYVRARLLSNLVKRESLW